MDKEIKEKKDKNKWLYKQDEEPDHIKNRPDWSNEKDRKETVFEPHPPTPLEDWLK